MKIIQCLLRIYPDWRGAVHDNDYNKIIPNELETRPIPALQELETAWQQIEAERLAREAIQAELQAAKQLAIVDGLPSAVQVKAAIDLAFPDAKQNAFMTKFVRAVYLDLKNSVD